MRNVSVLNLKVGDALPHGDVVTAVMYRFDVVAVVWRDAGLCMYDEDDSIEIRHDGFNVGHVWSDNLILSRIRKNVVSLDVDDRSIELDIGGLKAALEEFDDERLP